MLYIIATPIGNLKDITLRSLEVLETVDAIICEDTRRTSLLLNHYQIHKPLIILNDFNETASRGSATESKNLTQIIQRLKDGQNLALVSDAGTPLISDPGYKLVRECIAQKLEVDSLPGPSSVITALTLSGMPPDKFAFLGYLPEKPGRRKTYLTNLGGGTDRQPKEITYIIFISPHKLIKTLQDLKETLGDINFCLAHELTKIHQSTETKLISEWQTDLKNPKGEYIGLFRLN